MTNRKQRKVISRNQLIIKGLLLNILVSSPALLGFGIILATKGPLTALTLGIGCLIAGFSGVIVIIRKESPTSIVTVKGKRAILEGVLFTVICWGAAVYFWLAS